MIVLIVISAWLAVDALLVAWICVLRARRHRRDPAGAPRLQLVERPVLAGRRRLSSS